MARGKVTLNHPGIARLLKSAQLRAAVNKAAEEVAANVKAQGIRVGGFTGSEEINLPVTVREGVTDRVRATVTLAHPAGAAVQAKHGSLTKAAAQSGLKVNRG